MGESAARGFFELNEGIFLISSNHLEKQQIEDGLNREVTRIMSVGDLVRAFTDLTTSEGIRASVIITDDIPADIKKNLEEVKEGIEVSSVPVFEIATGELIEGAYRFGTIPDFISFARVNKRKAKIKEVKDHEQRSILEELQLETEVKQDKIDILEKELEERQEELEEVQGKYQSLNTEVEKVIRVQRDDAVERARSLENRVQELDRIYDIERRKSEQYRSEKDEALGEMTELRLTAASLDSALNEKQSELRKLERMLGDKEEDIKKLIREKDSILKSKVDAEEHVTLSEELNKARERIDKLNETILDMEVKNRKVMYEKEIIERENRSLQDGELNIKEIGRTMKLDQYKFERTDLIYIKVFESLPYMRLALEMFFDKLSEKVHGRSHMMILRHDDGMDAEYFKGVPLWSKLKDVPAEDRIFRLFPNHVMFARAKEWEKKVNLLIVVDNIKNNEYYLESRSMEKYMTVVRRETDLSKYNLKGSPITVEGKSVFDIRPDSKILNAGLQKNRRMMLEVKVQQWVDSIYD